jgi:2-amino-4-hydroxy-6-hydroxymethyldihydropteridine diphosphokinase
MYDIYILAGSNRGDRHENLKQAMVQIQAEAGRIDLQSSVYESVPWGFRDETTFYNQVIGLTTLLAPEELLDKLLSIEIRMGRIRFFGGCGCGAGGCETDGDKKLYEPRNIDLDILFYGSKTVFTDRLMVPHPRMHLRRFTLVPLAEVNSGFIHPVFRKPVSQLLSECTDNSLVTKL